MKKTTLLSILLILTSISAKTQITNNPPANSVKDNYSSGTYLRCAYNVNISETHLTNNVDYTVKAGESIRIQASSGTTPYSNIGVFSGGSFHAFVDPNYNLSGCGASGTIVWDNIYTGDGSISREMRPLNYQLYPRNSSNKGTVVFSGTDNGNNSTITFYTAKTNFNNVTSTYDMTTVNIVNKRFSFSLQIDAELSEYSFAYYLNNNPLQTTVTLAEHVVCGDAYIISGQSNAATTDLSAVEVNNLNNTYGGSTSYGKYSRTIEMYHRTSWGISSVGGDLAWNVGAWGLPMQYKIQETYGIPTCIINGAVGATSIEHHVPLPAFPNDFFFNPVNDPLYPALGTYPIQPGCFGRMNTRVYNAGLENNIKGVFWWQGDGGTDPSYNYIDHFTPLYNLWTKYYPNYNRTYLIQIPSWIENESGVRKTSEYQRQMSTVFPSTTVMSANGIKYHRTETGHEIHHQATGYIDMANRLFALLEKDVYGKTININDLTPPNIEAAYKNGTSISLKFNQNIYLNTAIGENIYDILSVIKFNNEPVTKSNPVISGQYLSFDVPSSTAITSVSYAGFIPGTTPANIDNVGCYIRNSKNIGALSFNEFPVTAGGPYMRAGAANENNQALEKNNFSSQVHIFPNPFSNQLTISSGFNKPINKLIITDLTGRIVYEKENTFQQLKFDLTELKPGVYFFVTQTDEFTETSKLIKTTN